jgi:arylsulfatase A-like enzyme
VYGTESVVEAQIEEAIGDVMASRDSGRPNVLWLGADQIRFDTLGVNGNRICRTPNMDRLAKEGVNFSRAYTNCCLCTPARASMFTGRYAFKHGMGTNCDFYHSLAKELPDPGMLLHPRLQELGYRCGFVGKWHVGTEKGPVDYGFEGMNIPGYGKPRAYPGFKSYLEEKNLTYALKPTIFGAPGDETVIGGIWDGPKESTPAHYLAECSIDMLESYAQTDEPFFLTCQFWGPHSPFLPSREFLGCHDRETIEPWINYLDESQFAPGESPIRRDDHYHTLPRDWNGWREIVGLYYDFTSLIDHEIGRILDFLWSSNLKENTIVVFSADHGDMTGSHNLFGKGFLFEESQKVPLMIAWPGHWESGRTSDALVYNMDIFPTVLDACGIPDFALDGESLRSHLDHNDSDGRTNRRSDLYIEFHGLRYLHSRRALVTEDNWKYILNPTTFDEVYDLSEDPGEMSNLLRSSGKRSVDKVEEHVKDLRERMVHAAKNTGDPLIDFIARYFGGAENVSGQPNPNQFT